MLKIIIPLAGKSDLYYSAGYIYPKPIIDINGKTMIECVIENTNKLNIDFQYIFIIKDEDATKYHLDNVLKIIAPNSEIVKLKYDTKGALCSIMMTIDLISEDDSLLILNGDQILDIDFEKVDSFWQNMSVDVGVITFKSVHPRWSYVRIENDEIIESAEKNPISDNAIAGYYYFKSSKLFFNLSYEVINNNVSYDNNFYVSSIINQYILKNKKIKCLRIDNSDYHSFYSPKMLSNFEKKYYAKD
jgi:bifunctional N-acetylglucosamine-1-phosphate-uridyltransferase/glucosamine-1-phosphate-acetyltransferase GlmU-like protein